MPRSSRSIACASLATTSAAIGRSSRAASPATIAVTRAEEPPSPLPGGASEAMSTSRPASMFIRAIAAFGRSMTPSELGPSSRWYSTRCPRSSERIRTSRSDLGEILTRARWSIVADRTAPPWRSNQCGRSVPPPTKLIRRGASARTSWWEGLGMSAVSMGRGSGPRPGGPVGGSGHEADQAAALLLGQPAPHAVPLPVLQGPGEAGLPEPARRAVGEGGGSLLLRGGEEQIGVDAVAGRQVLPHVRRERVRGERLQVDPGDPFPRHGALLPSARTQ